MDQRVTDLPQRAPEGTAGSEEPKHRTKIFVWGQFRILPIHWSPRLNRRVPVRDAGGPSQRAGRDRPLCDIRYPSQ